MVVTDPNNALRKSVPNTQPETLSPAMLQAHKLVLRFFLSQEPDALSSANKAYLWFMTPNPLLGDWTPYQVANVGREKQLLKFIRAQLDENKPSW